MVVRTSFVIAAGLNLHASLVHFGSSTSLSVPTINGTGAKKIIYRSPTKLKLRSNPIKTAIKKDFDFQKPLLRKRLHFPKDRAMTKMQKISTKNGQSFN